MSEESTPFSPEQFSGRARVFPLPNLVMFPHVMQALHIYETRYRAMLEEAIEDDRLIALAVLAPGWEQNYEGRPPLRPTACLCRIATHQRTKQGTYNVLLEGVRRMRIVTELPPKKLFREVEAELLDDVEPPDASPAAVADIQQELLAAFKRSLPQMPDSFGQIDQLLGTQISLGMLADIVSYTVELDLETKMRLLAECDVVRRTRLLLDSFADRPAAREPRRFPPDFSIN